MQDKSKLPILCADCQEEIRFCRCTLSLDDVKDQIKSLEDLVNQDLLSANATANEDMIHWFRGRAECYRNEIAALMRQVIKRIPDEDVKEIRGMQFDFEGKTYQIDFKREYKKVNLTKFEKAPKNVVTGKRGKPSKIIEQVLSTHPFTTAMIFEVLPDKPRTEWKLYQSARVGAHFRLYQEDRKGNRILDANGKPKVRQYTPAEGRLWALRSLTRTLPEDMKPRMWEAYLKRGEVKADVQGAEAETKANNPEQPGTENTPA